MGSSGSLPAGGRKQEQRPRVGQQRARCALSGGANKPAARGMRVPLGGSLRRAEGRQRARWEGLQLLCAVCLWPVAYGKWGRRRAGGRLSCRQVALPEWEAEVA
jgi:hypothetical protein